MRRWVLVLLVVVVALVIVAAIVAEAVRRSDMPRRMVVSAIEDATGLRASLGRLEAGWGGHTRLTDLALALPHADEPLIAAPDLAVNHTAILKLLITRSIDIDSVALTGATVNLVEDTPGRWNLQEALGMLPEREDEPRRDPIDLPRLALADATVHVTPYEAERITLGPIRLDGEPIGGAGWRFDAAVGDWAGASGRVATRGEFSHRVEVTMRRVHEQPIVRHFAPDVPEPIELAFEWDGRLRGERLTGRLDVSSARVGGYAGAGALAVTAGADGVLIEPRELTLAAADGAPAEEVALAADTRARGEAPGGDPFEAPIIVRVTGGRLHLDEQSIRAERLRVESFGAAGRFGGHIALDERTAELEGGWTGRVAETRHDGTLHVSYTQPTPGSHDLRVDLTTSGRTPWGDWDTSMVATAAALSLEDAEWRLEVPRGRFEWSGAREPILLDGAEAAGEVEWPEVRLTRLAMPHTDGLTAHAGWNADRNSWRVDVTAERFAPPQLPAPLFLSLIAEGDAARAEVERLRIAAPAGHIELSGDYVPARDTPLRTELIAEYTAAGDDALAAAAAGEDGADAAPIDFTGRAQWNGQVTGSIQPRDLRIEGDLLLEGVTVNGQPVEDLSTITRGRFDDPALVLRSDPFSLLEGDAEVALAYILDGRIGQVRVTLGSISLARTAALLNPDLALEGAADADLLVTLPDLDRDRMTISGDWAARGIRAHPLEIGAASGELRTRGRTLRLEPIHLRQGDGEAHGLVLYNLQDGRTSRVELEVDDWPLRVEPYGLDTALVGRVDLDLDLIERVARGRGDLTMDLAFEGRDALGTLSVRGEVGEDAITLDRIDADVLDGRIDGSARLDLGAWYNSTADVRWWELDLEPINDWFEDPVVTGRISGRLAAGPATNPRAHEPAVFSMELRPADAAVRGVPIGPADVIVFAGPRRILLYKADLGLADGSVSVWASVTRHVGQWYGQIHTYLDGLDINLLNRAVNPEAAPLIGRLGGEASLVGPIEDIPAIVGRGQFDLSQSDLANSRIIGTLFGAMRVDLREPEPDGQGEIRLRIDGGALHIDRFTYFNRGVDVFGAGAIRPIPDEQLEEDERDRVRLRLGPESPIGMTVGGTLRPLAGINLPLIREADRLLQALQGAVTTVRVSGTVGDTRVQVVPFAQVQDTLQRLITGEVDPEEEDPAEEATE